MKKFYLILPTVFLSNISSVCTLLPDQLLVNKNQNIISHHIVPDNAKNTKTSATSIASKIKWTLYLKTFCDKKFADDLAVVKNIRETLVSYHILTKTEAQFVQPRHYLIFLNLPNQYQLRVIKDGQTAFSPAIALVIWEYSKILHLQADDNHFCFLAYFTPEDYLFLKNMLLKSSEKYFLGTLMQILDDNDFEHDTFLNWIYSLPNLDDDSDYRHVFKWENRLEEHMGHFGDWTQNKSETTDAMIARDSYSRRPTCHNIETLVDELKLYIATHYDHNNNGMMLRLKWSFDDDYTYEWGNFW